MSGGDTDIYRDQRRQQLYTLYLIALIDWLNDPTEANRKLVLQAAQTTDSVRRGYHEGRTNLVNGLSESMEKLLAKDEEEWEKLLSSLNSNHPIYERIEALSPFTSQSKPT